MYDQIARLLGEVDTLTNHLDEFHSLHNQLREGVLEDHRTTYALVDSLRGNFKGDMADEFFAVHHDLAARARLSLQHFGDHATIVHLLDTNVQGARNQYHTDIQHAMGQAPDAVWEFLSERTTLPALGTIATMGANASEHLLSVWDRHVPAQMPSHQQDPVTGFLHWTYDHTIGAISSAVGNLFQAITSWGMELGAVRNIVGWVGNLQNDFHASLYNIFQTHLTMAAGTPCTTPSSDPTAPYKKPLPPPDTPAHIAARAQRLHQLLHDPNISEQDRGKFAMQYLQDLNYDELQQLDSSYAQQFNNAPFTTELFNQVKSPTWRYQLTQTLLPDQIQNVQQYPMSPNSDNAVSHIEMNPPNGTIALNVGASTVNQDNETLPVTFTFVSGKDRGTPKEIHSFVIPDTRSGYDAQSGASTKRTFYGTGDYTVVFEVRYASGPPVYYSYVQHVTTAREIAISTVQQMGPAPSPASLLLFYNALLQTTTDSQQKQSLQQLIAKIKGAFHDSNETPIPLQVSYAPETLGADAPSSIPLQLYAVKVPSTDFPGAYTWEIVDLTSPNGGPYKGGSFQDAWLAFLAHSPYPTGQMAMVAPPIPGVTSGVQCFEHLAGNPLPNPNDWASLIPFLQLLGMAAFIAGLAVSIFTVQPELAAAIFAIAGLAYAGSGALDLYLRWYNGTLAWDQDTAWDLFNIAAGIAGVGAAGLEVADVADSAVATSTSATSKMVMITRIGGLALGGAQGILVTWDTWVKIQQVLNSKESAADKTRDIALILGGASAQAGLIVIGLKSQWNEVQSLQDINKMRTAGVSDDLLATISQTKDQDALNAILSFLKTGSPDGTFSQERIDALNQAAQDYQQKLDSGELPQPGQSGYRSLTDYLMQSAEVLPNSNIWLSGLQIAEAQLAAKAAGAAGKLPADLVSYMESNPQMWGILANKNFQITDAVAQDLQTRWAAWQAGKVSGKGTFADYLNALRNTQTGITYPMSFGQGDRPLNVTIPNVDSLTGEQRQLAFLDAFTPRAQDGSSLAVSTADAEGNVTYQFNASLSADTQNFLKKVIGEVDTSADGTQLVSGVRTKFSQQFNQQFAADLVDLFKTNPAQAIKTLQEVIPYLEDASKGSITKQFFYQLLQSSAPGLKVEGQFPPYTMDSQDLNEFNQVYLSNPNLTDAERQYWEGIRSKIFAKTSTTGADPQIRPDLLSADGKVAVDVKAGYVSGAISQPQIAAYLLKMLRGDAFEHTVYLYAPGAAAGDAERGAVAAFATIAKTVPEKDLTYFSVYYMDENGTFFEVVPGNPPGVQKVPSNQVGQIFTVPPHSP